MGLKIAMHKQWVILTINYVGRQMCLLFIRMEPAGDEFYTAEDGDTRNVKAVARTRGKTVRMVTKAYGHKAVQKIMYSKEEKEKRRKEAFAVIEKEEDKKREAEEWADPHSDKKVMKAKAKEAKAEEKLRKKIEKMELYKSELSNGKKAKSQHL